MSTVSCFIFARGGSKSIKNKNLAKVGEQTLVERSIRIAQQNNRVSKVFVSSDSVQILAHAQELGARSISRPLELATDYSPEINSWKHALDFSENTLGQNMDCFLSLPPTSPLRKITDISRLLDKYEEGVADLVVCVTKSLRSPYFNICSVNDNGYLSVFASQDDVKFRRQDVPLTFDLTTVGYAVRPDYLKNASYLFEGTVSYIEVDRLSAVDIDDPEDLEYARYLYDRGGMSYD